MQTHAVRRTSRQKGGFFMRREQHIARWPALAAGILMALPLAAALAAPAHAASRPSFDEPQSLCNAITALPTRGWRHVNMLGWYCISDLRQYGPKNMNLPIPLGSTLQYSVSGNRRDSANQVQLFLTLNVPASRKAGLELMSRYAKTLSGHSAFSISNTELGDIAHGRNFSRRGKGYTITFKVQHFRHDQYLLEIDKAAM